MCAGVEVRAAAALKVTDATEIKSRSSLKAHFPALFSDLSSVFGIPGVGLDRDKAMSCWEIAYAVAS